MEDRRNPRIMSFPLPPGCRFYPSDHQLLRCYLSNKNSYEDDDFNGYDLIKELDLYEYEPFDLPDNVCYAYGCGGRRRHWYCYTEVRAMKESRGGRRSTKDGFWRKSGKVRDVVGPGETAVVGTRTRFVYYQKSAPKNSVRTDWVLYEYALLDHVKASFVLCRVFVKSRRGGGGGHSVSENVALSCCGEESVSAVRHVGVQYDGVLTADTVQSKVCVEEAGDRRNVLFKTPVSLSSEMDTGFQFNSAVLPNKLVSSKHNKDQLLAILEDDFIELDDLMD